MHFLIRVPVIAGISMLCGTALTHMLLVDEPNKENDLVEIQRDGHAAGCLTAIRKQSQQLNLELSDAAILNYCRCLSAQYIKAGVFDKPEQLMSIRPTVQEFCGVEHLGY